MFSFLRRKPLPTAPAAVPAGQRVYAIGDIHGRSDLLDPLLALIEEDQTARPPAEISIVFLGDYIDRGPDSHGVVERLATWPHAFAHPIFLMGNHEDAMLAALHGDTGSLRDWLRFGGLECIASYGIERPAADAPPTQLLATLQAAVPPHHVAFLEALYDSFAMGDYWFVHAGVRPGVALAEQDPADLRWIREDFLAHRGDHGAVIVHGHSIVDAVDMRPNRIAIDLGAYRTGRLAAVRLEGIERGVIVAEAA